jgi:hypothetical protein
MTRQYYSTLVCDNCEKIIHFKPADNVKEDEGWYQLTTFPPGAEFMDYVQLDFCSFSCLRAWANGQGRTQESPKAA